MDNIALIYFPNVLRTYDRHADNFSRMLSSPISSNVQLTVTANQTPESQK